MKALYILKQDFLTRFTEFDSFNTLENVFTSKEPRRSGNKVSFKSVMDHLQPSFHSNFKFLTSLLQSNVPELLIKSMKILFSSTIVPLKV